MLNFSDRQRRFQQLRAHWEAAETVEGTNMVGRREKQIPHHVVREDLQHNAGSKFRRKLSHGLALISLTQRKSMPGRQLSSNASLAVSALSTNDSSTAILNHDALLSPQTDCTSVTTSTDPSSQTQDSTRTSEDLQTPRQLPRSRTFSYIPRPVKIDAEAGPVVELDEATESSLNTVMTDTKPLPPSRIPTPSPPQSRRRVSSPRQYLPQHPPMQARSKVNCQSFTGIKNGSPSKAAVRSRTTPNLMQATYTSWSASYMAPRRPGLKRPFASSTLQKPVLAENIPTTKRVAQRRSQIQENVVKWESLSVPTATSNRRSFEPGVPLAQSKRASLATSSISLKRLSSHIAQTSVTARRVSTKGQEGLRETDSPRASEDVPAAIPPLRVPESSPIPILSTVDFIDPLLAPPPRLDADNDTQRTLGTPNGLGGVWRSSKVFAAANYQVRRVPRSSTFHHFGRRREAHPPVPPIPKQYKPPSSLDLVHSIPQQYTSPSLSNLHHRFPIASGKFGSSSRSLLSEIVSVQKSTEAASSKSMLTFLSATASEVAEDAEEEQRINKAREMPRHQVEASAAEHESHNDTVQEKVSSTSSSNPTALPPVTAKPHLKCTKRSVSIPRSEKSTGDLQIRRRWSITERFYPDSANDATRVQVKDYMPPSYWAGRFQSRFDQWRTEAMVAVLDPDTKPEDEGPLGQLSLDDERKATIMIFMQLRDLCASAQAADSLHEFEYRYRKDHKMLDPKHDLPPSLRKPEQSTSIGPIGRAVRKLTPRKASFANLFKGKGWNRNDDTNPVDMPGHVRELQEIMDLSNRQDDTRSTDSVESEARLHAH